MSNIVDRVPIAARLVLGLVFVAHGLNGFVNLVPQDLVPLAAAQVPVRAATFVAALTATGYVFPLVNAVEIVAGILLLSNLFVPFALALLAPIVINVVAFYLVLAAVAPGGLVLAALTLALEGYVAWTHREAFGPMLAAHTSERARRAHPGREPRTA
jgi:uncharacterized membrane protein YphA (DoxX/SURF4 family)